jgi:shikimate dehydrogenase
VILSTFTSMERPGTSDSIGYGLIGYPLTHSFSPAYFSEKFAREGIEATYAAFPLAQITDLPALIAEHPYLRGLNVTTPYKQSVLPYLNSTTDDARAIGAVNCISVTNGRLRGHNTDWIAFKDSLSPLLKSHHTRALILGSGGALSAVKYALDHLAIPHNTVSRTPGKGDYLYEDLTSSIIATYPIIINTTTLGTHGIGCPALPYEALSDRVLLFDLVYNPALTPFLAQGIEYGAAVKNGLEMLHLQAEASWAIWQQ